MIQAQDGGRMVFFGSTAAGSEASSSDTHFFAYDLARRKTVYHLEYVTGLASLGLLRRDGVAHTTIGTIAVAIGSGDLG